MKNLLILILTLITFKSFGQDLDNGHYFLTKELPVQKSDIKNARDFIKKNLDDFNKGVKIYKRKKLNPVLDSLKKKRTSVKIEQLYFRNNIISDSSLSNGNIQLEINDRKRPFCFFTVKKTFDRTLIIVLFGDDTL
jgi:hypothetical protein